MKNMIKDLMLVSIIVPIYNTAIYLEQCLDSIINQTYNNIEIILINDGSTDDSGKVCDAYAQKDSRIIVIHQENKGLAATRNIGIEVSTGDYIMFLDSDDWLDNDICEILVSALREHNVQISMCSYTREYPNKSIPKVVYDTDKIFCGREILRKLCGPVDEELKYPENIECFNSMCGKLYPRELLLHTKVVDTAIIGPSEDLLFNLHVFLAIESVVYVNCYSYHYRKNVFGSITTSYKPSMADKWNNLYDIIFNFIEKNKLSKEYNVAFDNRVALNILGLGLNCVNDKANLWEKYQRIKKDIFDKRRKCALKELSLKEMPFYWKFFYFCAKNDFKFLLCLLLIIIHRLKGKI